MPGFESLHLGILLWVVAVIAFAGWVQGALGLGFPMVATPLIAAVTDMRTAVIVVVVPCIACVATNVAKTGSLRPVLARFWAMPLYMVLGAAAGTQLFISFPRFPYALMLAGMILFYLGLERLGRTDWPLLKSHPAPFGALCGVIAGAVEGTANIAAPPLVIYYLALGVAPVVLVQGLNICFLTGKTTQFATLAIAGGVDAMQWFATLPLALVACVTVVYGIRVRNRIDAGTYRTWLKRALFAMALVLVTQYAWLAARA